MNQTPFAVRAVIPLVTMVLGATAGLGCALETAPEEDNIAETRQAFGRWFWSWGTTAGPDLDLGSDIGKTCFLAGVAGNLSVGLNTGYSNPRAEARVYRSGGKYWLRARANQYGTGTTPVLAHAVCVNWTTGRTGDFLWTTGDAELKELPGTAAKLCFLTGLSGQAGTWDGDWVGEDYARLEKWSSMTNWKLRARVSGQGYAFPQVAQVRTACFDLPAGLTYHSSWIPGSSTASILYDTNGGACGLTGVGGRFNTNVWDDGALVDWPSALPGWWKFRVKHLTNAQYQCLY